MNSAAYNVLAANVNSCHVKSGNLHEVILARIYGTLRSAIHEGRVALPDGAQLEDVARDLAHIVAALVEADCRCAIPACGRKLAMDLVSLDRLIVDFVGSRTPSGLAGARLLREVTAHRRAETAAVCGTCQSEKHQQSVLVYCIQRRIRASRHALGYVGSCARAYEFKPGERQRLVEHLRHCFLRDTDFFCFSSMRQMLSTPIATLDTIVANGCAPLFPAHLVRQMTSSTAFDVAFDGEREMPIVYLTSQLPIAAGFNADMEHEEDRLLPKFKVPLVVGVVWAQLGLATALYQSSSFGNATCSCYMYYHATAILVHTDRPSHWRRRRVMFLCLEKGNPETSNWARSWQKLATLYPVWRNITYYL